MSAKQQKAKSVIYCKDRDLRAAIVQMMTSIGFPGEKVSSESIEGTKAHLVNDLEVKNLVVDCSSQPEKEVVDMLKSISPLPPNRDISALIYLTSKSYQDLFDQFDKTHSDLHFKALPIKKADFNEAFCVNRGKRRSSPMATSNLPFVEATNHVKETIDLINVVAKDQSRIKDVLTIGQRFNGFFGTYTFFEQLDGYSELRQMAIVIDDISRTYAAKAEAKEVSQKHFDLMLNAARNAFKCLKELRDSLKVSAESKDAIKAVFQDYQATTDILRRTSCSQQEIDDLLESESKKMPA